MFDMFDIFDMYIGKFLWLYKRTSHLVIPNYRKERRGG